MARQHEKRQLLALLMGDIVDYSRLMAEYEADTFHRVKDLQSSLIRPSIAHNSGRVIKWVGDGFIAAFESAVDAIRAAVEIQSGAIAAAVSSPEERRIRFRMGVNVGDVIVVPGDVYGDVVNIAARLQGLAQPDGICVSRSVRDSVRNKFEIDFEERGEFSVKNIPEPVGIFDVRYSPIAWTTERPQELSEGQWFGRNARIGIMAVTLLCAVSAGILYWSKRGSETTPGLQGSTTALREGLKAVFVSALPNFDLDVREEQALRYERAPFHKAQAASLSNQSNWRAFGWPTREQAVQAVLESCQSFFASPCALLTINDEIEPIPADGRWRIHDMPRARYNGTFDPNQIPYSAVPNSSRDLPEITQYRSTPGPKAIAYSPLVGRLFTVSGASDQRSAEAQALAACTADPERRMYRPYPSTCFLYAVGNQVVLPLRRVEPLTAASPISNVPR